MWLPVTWQHNKERYFWTHSYMRLRTLWALMSMPSHIIETKEKGGGVVTKGDTQNPMHTHVVHKDSIASVMTSTDAKCSSQHRLDGNGASARTSACQPTAHHRTQQRNTWSQNRRGSTISGDSLRGQSRASMILHEVSFSVALLNFYPISQIANFSAERWRQPAILTSHVKIRAR
ncbi:hypothetical protein Tco_0828422 [Tanacetum coccineum]